LITINTVTDPAIFTAYQDVKSIIIAVLRADESTVILSILLTGFYAGNATLDLPGIKTEKLRPDEPKPGDVYVAVLEDSY
jgi:hypothetical protein